MRSYYAHLETAAPSAKTNLMPRPTFRSSAIFPVMQASGISSRILFMGYWILKRHIREVAAVITLRDTAGIVLSRSSLLIQEAKTFRIELADQLANCGMGSASNFTGSMEIEFFSTQNLFFPFPAVVINYYGPCFSTVVHTAQRVYNDYDDMKKNSQTVVPESGFNIYADEEREPFIGLINGSLAVNESNLRIEFFNSSQDSFECPINLASLMPYETRMIYPARYFNLKSFLNGRPGTAKIHFQVNWIFPRLIVGNIHNKIPAVTITHTYYDCSKAELDSDYWRAPDAASYPAALMVPAAIANNHFTNVYFYPIYSPATFALDVEIYDNRGKLLAAKKNALNISSSQPQFHCIPLKFLCDSLGIPASQNYAARLIARPADGSRFPARIKLGLDIGISGLQTPCNICTNLQPFNPALEAKPSSFRWAPILADQESATVWIMNTSPAVNYTRQADVQMTFFHESDAQTLKRTISLSPNAFVIIHVNEDEELRNFFNGTIGWMTAITTNPYTSVYYFAESSAGVTGGDHGF